jgi:hypothetical protein
MSDEPQEPDIASLPLHEMAAYQERLAQQYSAFPCVMVLGFTEEPDDSIYSEIEAHGGVLLSAESHETLGEVERMPRWKYLLWRVLWRIGIKVKRPRGEPL